MSIGIPYTFDCLSKEAVTLDDGKQGTDLAFVVEDAG